MSQLLSVHSVIFKMSDQTFAEIKKDIENLRNETVSLRKDETAYIRQMEDALNQIKAVRGVISENLEAINVLETQLQAKEALNEKE
mgnify:CR=1 FL=1